MEGEVTTDSMEAGAEMVFTVEELVGLAELAAALAALESGGPVYWWNFTLNLPILLCALI